MGVSPGAVGCRSCFRDVQKALTGLGPLSMSGGPSPVMAFGHWGCQMGWWPITMGSRRVGSHRPKRRAIRPLQRLELQTAHHLVVMLYTGRQGVTLYSWKGPYGVRLWAEGAESYDEVLSMKKKSPPSNSGGQQHLAAIESNILSQCLALVKHMAVVQYDDGTVRKPGWITIKTFGSAWQVEAKDPDSCLSLRVIENSLDEALQLLALLLESDEAPWEVDTWLQQQAAKIRKK